MVNAYYFIKFNKETSLEYVLKRSNPNTTICFDFEDSLQNYCNTEENHLIKANYRNYFQQFIFNNHLSLQSCKIGVRINSENSNEQDQDIQAIQSVKDILRVDSILLPKTENCLAISTLHKKLLNSNIEYDKVIPIIETKNGLNELPKIAETFNHRIKTFGFGHCDYNRSIKAFPYFHQDSKEYWRWIIRIHSILNPYDINLINSAFLQMDNHDYFNKTLGYLKHICGLKFSQFTITHAQSIQCMNFRDDGSSDYNFMKERFNLKPEKSTTEELISEFETENQNMGFTIGKKRILISPHEYLSAKEYLLSQKKINKECVFLGGCFPVQYNILFEDNFLQLIKNKIEREYNLCFNTEIIWYERFCNCIEKIERQRKNNPIDILVFHIRPEPFLRNLKFYYRYVNNDGEVKKAINFILCNHILSERFDYYALGQRYPGPTFNRKSLLYKFFIDTNYLLGVITGNYHGAIKKYFELSEQIIKYCNTNNISLVILGPTLRSETKLEKLLSAGFLRSIEKKHRKKRITFISGIDKTSKYQNEYFHKNGIHANEKYHGFISKIIIAELQKLFDKYKKN